MPPVFEDTEEIELVSPEQDDAGISPEIEQPADAVSSAATDASKPEAEEDPLSVVRDVVDKRKDPATEASSAKSEEAGEQPGDTQLPKAGAEDYSDVPFNKHPRFQALLAEKRELQTDAVRYRNVQNFLDREGLSGEEAAGGLTLLARAKHGGLNGDELADGLAIMALSKTNPVEALARAKPWMQNLLIAAGEVIPDDLKVRVNAGEMSRETAIEMSRSRAQIQSHEVQRTFAQQQAQARQQQEADRQQQEAVGALMGAAGAWEADRRAKDPGFEAKLPAIMAEVQKLRAMGWVPQNPEGVREQLRRAYTAVNNSLRTPAAPTPAAAKPALRPITGGHVAGNVRSTGNEDLDLVNEVLARRRSG